MKNKERIIYDSNRDFDIKYTGDDGQFYSPVSADVAPSEYILFDRFQAENNITLVEIIKWWIRKKNVTRSDLIRAIELAFAEITIIGEEN